MSSFRTAVPMTAEGPRKGESSTKTMRNGLHTQPALSVRGSSRRIMALRFRPAHISVINRRECLSVVIGTSVRNVFPFAFPDHYRCGEGFVKDSRCRASRVLDKPLSTPQTFHLSKRKEKQTRYPRG